MRAELLKFCSEKYKCYKKPKKWGVNLLFPFSKLIEVQWFEFFLFFFAYQGIRNYLDSGDATFLMKVDPSTIRKKQTQVELLSDTTRMRLLLFKKITGGKNIGCLQYNLMRRIIISWTEDMFGVNQINHSRNTTF